MLQEAISLICRQLGAGPWRSEFRIEGLGFVDFVQGVGCSAFGALEIGVEFVSASPGNGCSLQEMLCVGHVSNTRMVRDIRGKWLTC